MTIDRTVRNGFAAFVLVAALGAAAVPATGQTPSGRLGALTVLSDRSQPFEAVIELDGVTDPSTATPQIVAPSTYADLGVPFPAVLRGATVTVERRGAEGRPIVRLRSPQRVEGSELVLVMSLTTATGRHLRSYKVDLDASSSAAAAPPPAPALRVETVPPSAVPPAAAAPAVPAASAP
ncbi:MAG: hypothetical protein WCK28_13430, partial [Burkholderiales bacterium]